MKALGAYTLTLKNVRATRAVIEEADRIGYNPPEAKEDESLEQVIRRAEKDATMAGLRRKAGLSARDLVMTLLAVTSGVLYSGSAPGEVPPELTKHVRFVKSHEAEVAPLMKLMDGSRKKDRGQQAPAEEEAETGGEEEAK